MTDQAINAAIRHALVGAVHRHEPVLLMGPPGVGKTMIARRLTSLITLSDHAKAWLHAERDGMGIADSVSRVPEMEPPFRAPHYTISTAALVGDRHRALPKRCECGRYEDGACTRPYPPTRCLPRARVHRAGEADLARFGVLLLDEVHEFAISALESLRERLRRMGDTAPLVVLTASGCPCGWYGAHGSPARTCTCVPTSVERHQARLRRALVALGFAIHTIVEVPMLSLVDMREHEYPFSVELLRATAAERCWVCAGPMVAGDEPGSCPMDNGVHVPVCSVACTEHFFAGGAA